MDFQVNLNPEEVLSHLIQLGYHDISPLQLKEFIRDLKKLIKYDLKQQHENAPSRIERKQLDKFSTLTTSATDNSSSHSSDYPDLARRPLTQVNSNTLAQINNTGSTSTMSSSDSSSHDPSSSSGCYETTEKQKPTRTQPRPSFIRPHNLHSKGKPPPRSDPVALYHYYEQFWRQFKLPGEDEHRQLRWNVRERMLGRAPPSSQVSRPNSRTSAASLRRS